MRRLDCGIIKIMQQSTEGTFNVSEVINPPLPTILKEKTKVFFFLCRGLDENHEKWFEREPVPFFRTFDRKEISLLSC